MEFTPITGLQIRRDFYTSSGCVLEDVIENYFYQHFKTVNPYIIGRKESIARKPTDGIIRFYDEEMHLKFWILQETKRDKGINSVFLHRSFLQALMYLGNIYYDTNTHLGVDKFNGIFLDSARYFCYVPRKEIDILMEKFEPLWRKYFQVSPSKAHKEEELEQFAIRAAKILKPSALDEHFRLDLLLKEIYYNNV
jgi:hypothetical protein|nr:MAG TPA: hypothetical protein [Bacteriophage sp.]